MKIIVGIIVVAILFIVLTGKSRRANKMKDAIYKLILSGREYTILSDVYFEAALKFALESGAELEPGQSKFETNSINFKMNIDGTNYFIFFAKQLNGSTFLGISNADEAAKQFRDKISKNIKETTPQSARQPEQTLELVQVLAELFELRQDTELLEVMQLSAAGMPISAFDYDRVQNAHTLMHKLSELTGQTLEELFDRGGLQKIIVDTSEGKVSFEGLGLIDVIKKTNKHNDGAFIDIYSDLNDHIPQTDSPVIMMAYAYAMRTAAAGLFLQAVIDRDIYNELSMAFKKIQLVTDQTVAFQEEAARQSCELFSSYDDRLDQEAIMIITSMVELNKSSEIYTGNGKISLPYDLVIAGIQKIAVKRYVGRRNGLNLADNQDGV